MNSCTSEVILEKPNPLGNNASGSDMLFERDHWFYHRQMWEDTGTLDSTVLVDIYHSFLLQQLTVQQPPHILVIDMAVTAEEGWSMESVQIMRWSFPSQRCLSM